MVFELSENKSEHKCVRFAGWNLSVWRIKTDDTVILENRSFVMVLKYLRGPNTMCRKRETLI